MNSVANEIGVLRGFADRHEDGTVIAGEAFGQGARLTGPRWADQLKSADFNFSIKEDGDRLLLSIDTYTAVNGVMSAGDPFDVDAWEDGFLEFRGAIARSTFRALHQMARALLTGRMVRLCAPDGRQEIYDGIPGATVRQRPYRRA